MTADDLVLEAREWVRQWAMPLPVDLVANLIAAGVDAGALEDQLLQETN